MGRATWTTYRVIVAHLLRLVLVSAFHLLFGLHLQRLNVRLRVLLLLQCYKLRLHISVILASIAVHLLLLKLDVLALSQWREFVLLSEGVCR